LQIMFETPKAIKKKMFTSVFKAYQGALILCCSTTDLGILYYCSWNFWSCICESPDALQSIMVKCKGQAVKSCSVAAKHFPQAGQVSPKD